MKKLWVIFDAECALCLRCRQWLAQQAAFIPLEFIPLQSPDLDARFPGITALHPSEQLLAVSDNGDVYRGAHAWLMCLYALRDYREWSQRLATPALLPWAQRVCELLSQNRLTLSRWLLKRSAHEIEASLTLRSFSPTTR